MESLIKFVALIVVGALVIYLSIAIGTGHSIVESVNMLKSAFSK